MHTEVCINEKAAFEQALAGAYAAKRTACLFSVEGVYEALDPLMSSAYTGVKGGFVVLCVKEGLLDVSPLGPFSKLPVLVSDGDPAGLSHVLSFAFDLSERYEMPCLVETLALKGPVERADARSRPAGRSAFVKNPNRWAAIPKFRYELHKGLNEKIDRIREEFEAYEGNVRLSRGGNKGIITHRACTTGAVGEDVSILTLGSVFPLPLRTVESFIDSVEEARILEGPYPAIEMQVRQGRRMDGELAVEPARATCRVACVQGTGRALRPHPWSGTNSDRPRLSISRTGWRPRGRKAAYSPLPTRTTFSIPVFPLSSTRSITVRHISSS